MSFLINPYRFALSGGGGDPDPYFDNVVLLAGFNGTHGATTTTDESNSNHTVSMVGTTPAYIDTTQKVFGVSSVRAGQTFGACVSIPDSADWHLMPTGLSDAWTIEFWFRGSFGGTQGMISQYQTTGNQRSWQIYTVSGATPNFRLRYSTNGTNFFDFVRNVSFVNDTWYAMAFDYDGTNVRMYKDGVFLQKAALSGAFFNSNTPLIIGAQTNASAFFNGWFDEVRITKGVARYASDGGYTVPVVPFPRIGPPV